MTERPEINRLKIVLAEKRRTGKWLAEQMGVTPQRVSTWVSQAAQPTLLTLIVISRHLDVDVRELIISTK